MCDHRQVLLFMPLETGCIIRIEISGILADVRIDRAPLYDWSSVKNDNKKKKLGPDS